VSGSGIINIELGTLPKYVSGAMIVIKNNYIFLNRVLNDFDIVVSDCLVSSLSDTPCRARLLY